MKRGRSGERVGLGKFIALVALLIYRVAPSIIKVQVRVASGTRRFRRTLIRAGMDKRLADRLTDQYENEVGFLRISHILRIISSAKTGRHKPKA